MELIEEALSCSQDLSLARRDLIPTREPLSPVAFVNSFISQSDASLNGLQDMRLCARASLGYGLTIDSEARYHYNLIFDNDQFQLPFVRN